MEQEESNQMPKQEYKSVHHYVETLRNWLYWQQQPILAQSFQPVLPLYSAVQSTYLNNGQIIIPGSANFTYPHSPPVHAPTARQTQPDPVQRGQEFVLPEVWKRVVAELIDFFIALIVKIILSLTIFSNFRLLQEERMDLDFIVSTLHAHYNERDIEKLLSLTTEMLTTQIIHRFTMTIVETLWLYTNPFGSIGGCTPGKLIMGLRVIGGDDVMTAGPDRVLIIRPRNLGFLMAFNRSLLKNFGIWFFVPVLLSVFFMDHRRAIYDVAAGSIVVCSPPSNQGPAADAGNNLQR